MEEQVTALIASYVDDHLELFAKIKMCIRDSTCPDALRLSDVIEGWQVALQKMHVGDKWIIYIPYAMGYGIKLHKEYK